MNESFNKFTDTAQGLAKNPIGIIALFIVLVYGIASLITVFATSFTIYERIPLVYFLVIFPVLALGAFVWLVSKHASQLYSPSDFKDEENYVKMQLSATLALATAESHRKPDSQLSEEIIEIISKTKPIKTEKNKWQNKIFWVDDSPDNNAYERRAFESFGFSFTSCFINRSSY